MNIGENVGESSSTYIRGPLFGSLNTGEIAKLICEFLVGNQSILEVTNFRSIAEDFNDNSKTACLDSDSIA